MKNKHMPGRHAGRSLEIFQPRPEVLYSLDVAAHLALIPRRTLLIYCRAGLVRPIFLPPYGAMAFTEEAVYTLRQVERVRVLHGADLAWIKTLFDLRSEVERLRAEVRFLRGR